MKKETKTITTNKKAFHNYTVETEYQSGIVLQGCEIKSIRNGELNISDSYCVIQNGEVWIKNMYIKPYGNRDGFMININPHKDRKLLLTKHEIRKLEQKVKTKGYTIVPLKVIINEHGYCKVMIGLCKGKHEWDKKQSIKEKDLKRDMERSLM